MVMNKEYDEKKDTKFYDTSHFEIHCFCQLFEVNNKKILEDEIKETNYFLVGGFDIRKNKGYIKLYKYNNKEIFEINEFININQKKEIDKNDNTNKQPQKEPIIFKGFKNAISCIEQSKINGKIYATCWDGNVYFFDNPILLLTDYHKILNKKIY